MNNERWYNNPDRRCAGNNLFTEIPSGAVGRKIAKDLIRECNQCPVIDECFDDALYYYGEPGSVAGRGVVQGGVRW